MTTTWADLGLLAQRWHDSGYKDGVLIQLRDALDKLNTPPPPHICAWCGMTDEDNEDAGFGPLVDITVETARGEEGHAHVVKYACYEHLETVTAELVALGFGHHYHGSTNFLEPPNCPGTEHYGECPTPSYERSNQD